jgi:hypothetical protein
MPRDRLPRQNTLRARIAAAAARLIAEDGIDDFSAAKRKAARQLGAADTQSLPANEEIEVELRAYQTLYQPEEQAERLRELRAIALKVMQALADFNPYLTGSVLKGTAGRYADIDLQLFSDDLKAIEMFLVNRGVPYDTRSARHYCGDQPRPVELLKLQWEDVAVNVAVYAANDERSNLKASPTGRPIERATLTAVRALVPGISNDAAK